MSKGSGSTRASSSGAPAGLNPARTFSGWRLGEDSLGAPAIRKRGEEARIVYNALSSSVERAVESKVGNIRSGGGFTGESDNREYTIIFRNNATYPQIRSYMEEMTTGAKLYAKMNDRNISENEYIKASAEYDDWFNKTYRR